MTMELLLFSIALSLAGAFSSLVLRRFETAAKFTATLFGASAALLALGAGFLGIFGLPDTLSFATPFSFASLSLLINPLSGLLIVVINLLALVAWLYGIGYLREYTGKGIGVLGLFMNLFIASMNLVVAADNVFWFLIFFEIMSLASYFLVIFDQKKASIKAGFLYLIMAHVGFFLIMIAFFVMSTFTGSFDFASFRETDFGKSAASLVFVLCFLGFGIKAGMVPLHSWLPKAHPAAPSHVSALMSGAMIKIGIFGILKVGLELLAGSGVELWWGIIVLIMGACSAVLGIAYALAESDIKRLLAYCSVENIGIIFMGVGITFVGVALQMPVIATLGLLAALFHLVNHALFKGLLFLGTGAVIHRTHTRDMGKLGGLVRTMPLTAFCFLIGSLAIAAVPPLNGFASEWFTFQSLISAALASSGIIKAVAAFALVALAITGGLAVLCFVKAFGVSFLGTARSEAAFKATEVPLSMKLPLVLLAVCCVCMGVGAPWVVPVVEGIAASVLIAPGIEAAAGMTLVNPDVGGAISTPLVAVLIVALVALPFLLRAVLARGRQATDSTKEPWACGYVPNTEMPMIAASFAAPAHMFLKPVYVVQAFLAAQQSTFHRLFKSTVKSAEKIEPLPDRYLVDSVTNFTTWLGRKAQAIEGGNVRVYLTYIILALIVLLIITALVGVGGAL
ncbi:MAG: hydrogenase 4 subunit B [Coriobacteriia bacterium]|nr:hydrogenase 4 subunit B [Coriobacteriia bacterium]